MVLIFVGVNSKTFMKYASDSDSSIRCRCLFSYFFVCSICICTNSGLASAIFQQPTSIFSPSLCSVVYAVTKSDVQSDLPSGLAYFPAMKGARVRLICERWIIKLSNVLAQRMLRLLPPSIRTFESFMVSMVRSTTRGIGLDERHSWGDPRDQRRSLPQTTSFWMTWSARPC